MTRVVRPSQKTRCEKNHRAADLEEPGTFDAPNPGGHKKRLGEPQPQDRLSGVNGSGGTPYTRTLSCGKAPTVLKKWPKERSHSSGKETVNECNAEGGGTVISDEVNGKVFEGTKVIDGAFVSGTFKHVNGSFVEVFEGTKCINGVFVTGIYTNGNFEEDDRGIYENATAEEEENGKDKFKEEIEEKDAFK